MEKLKFTLKNLIFVIDNHYHMGYNEVITKHTLLEESDYDRSMS